VSEFVAPVGIFVVVAVAAFAASIRLGMLLGRRLDRALEVRALAAGGESEPDESAPTEVSDGKEDRCE
jgi:NADH:ubiquinone oxidoreductase subunit 3 (subunit A)